MKGLDSSARSYNYERFDTSAYGLGPFTNAPRVGECAPDFEAMTLDGKRVRLSDFKGKRIVLETGSITCPMFGGNIEPMNAVANKLSDDETVFLVLYTREAHPGAKAPAHRTMEDKKTAAGRAAALVNDKRLVLIETVDGMVHRRWGELPNSVWIIGADGVVRFRSDWNKASMVEQLLAAEQLDTSVLALREHNKPGLDAVRSHFHVAHFQGWLEKSLGHDLAAFRPRSSPSRGRRVLQGQAVPRSPRRAQPGLLVAGRALRHPLKFFENSHEGGKAGSKISGKSSRLPAFMFNFSLKTATK